MISFSPAAEEPFRVAAILITEEIDFWSRAWQGVREAAKENGIALSEYSFPHSQSDDILDWVDMAVYAEVDGIIVRGQDNPSEEVRSALKRAREQGIIIITLDVDTGLRDAYFGIDNIAAARLLGEEALRLREAGGDIALVRNAQSIRTVKTRVDAFIDYMKEMSPDTEIKTHVYSRDNGDVVDGMRRFLEENPNVRIIFTGGPVALEDMSVAAARVQNDARYTILGFTENNALLAEIDAKNDHVLVVQDPYQMGKRAMETMASMLEGEAPETDVFLIPVSLQMIEGN